MNIASEDIYRETTTAYYVKIGGEGHCFLKEEVLENGLLLQVPDIKPRQDDQGKYNAKIRPSEMIRQKHEENMRLEDIAKYWGVSISTVRKVFLTAGAEIPRAHKGLKS